jgi:hypothetical protein
MYRLAVEWAVVPDAVYRKGYSCRAENVVNIGLIPLSGPRSISE